MRREGEYARSETNPDKGILNLLKRTHDRFRGVNGHIYAAAISYFSLISLFPWLIFIVTMLSITVRDPVLQSQIITQVVEQFPPGARIRGELRAFVAEITVRQSGLLGVVGLVTTVIVASEAFRALRYALNAVFGIPQQRSILRGRGIDLLGMLVVLVFGTISAAMTAFLQFDWLEEPRWILGAEGSVTMGILRYFLTFLLSFLAFVLMYRIVPEVRLDWSVLWIPGLIAATGFELARFGMALFLSYFGRFQQLYGALSVTVVTLVFVFVMANIVLVAAALAWEIAENREPSRSVDHNDNGV
jgi:membrane protein